MYLIIPIAKATQIYLYLRKKSNQLIVFVGTDFDKPQLALLQHGQGLLLSQPKPTKLNFPNKLFACITGFNDHITNTNTASHNKLTSGTMKISLMVSFQTIIENVGTIR